MARELDPRTIAKLSGSVSEARGLANADRLQREMAAHILEPGEVRGDYNASRMLMTTLGGKIRPITSDDLAQFRHNSNVAGNRFKGGITARNVIDMSLSIDRERARKEITMAVPSNARGVKGGRGRGADFLEVRFITNAGPDSDVQRHFVAVEFMDYPTAVTAGGTTPQRAAVALRKGSIRFDCDCGRHRYWYRYLATLGRYNAGRAETGFPKIRNPNLYGVACKHALRVMAEIEGGGSVQSFLARAIEKGRASGDGSGSIRQKQKEAERIAAKQAKRPRSGGDTGDRDFDRSRRALVKQSRATTTRPKRVANGSKRFQALAGVKDAESQLLAYAAQMGITPEQAIDIFSRIKN